MECFIFLKFPNFSWKGSKELIEQSKITSASLNICVVYVSFFVLIEIWYKYKENKLIWCKDLKNHIFYDERWVLIFFIFFLRNFYSEMKHGITWYKVMVDNCICKDFSIFFPLKNNITMFKCYLFNSGVCGFQIFL